MSTEKWEVFTVLLDRMEAERLAAFLESSGVPSYIDHGALDLGLDGGFRVFVTAELAHRAHWLVAQPEISDAELEFLATGKLPGADE